MTAGIFIALFASSVLAQPAGTFTITGSMRIGRAAHTATLLFNGKVLITGGYSGMSPNVQALSSAELYDPATGIFSPTGNMTTARASHSATLLADGRVLVTGGGARYTTELYDPATGAFTEVSDMIVSDTAKVVSLQATLLADGRVLIAHPAAAELYDPSIGRFTLAGAYVAPIDLVGQTVLLADGRVLLTGCSRRCSSGATSVYHPHTDAFTTAGPMPGFDNVNTSTLLLDGKALFVGNFENDGWPAQAELYDPSTGSFTRIADATEPHEFGAATLLPDGTVLVTGGGLPEGAADIGAEIYNPDTVAFVGVGGMVNPRYYHTSTLLPDGTVLIAGGGLRPVSASAEIYTPPVLVPAPALLSLSGDGKGVGAILHADTHLLVSPDNPAVAGEALEIYCSGLNDGSVIPPQVTIGNRTAEILFFGKAPGFAGLNQVNVRVPNGVMPGDAVSVRLTYLARPSNEVTIGVR